MGGLIHQGRAVFTAIFVALLLSTRQHCEVLIRHVLFPLIVLVLAVSSESDLQLEKSAKTFFFLLFG